MASTQFFYSVFLHAIFHPTSFTKRRRDSRVSTSASYVPSPGEFQPVARPEFMKPLEFIMILQVAGNFGWLLDILVLSKKSLILE